MISVEKVTYERYFQPVFHPVTFALERGELLMLTGPNGSGKTTLIRVLSGVLAPSSGRIERRASACAHVGHHLAIKDDLSVAENLQFARAFLGQGGTTVDQAIEALGLGRVSAQLARTLSAGQRKRCALARLLLHPADLWFLDEPYASLDADGCTRVDHLLAEHVGRGGACVMATHGAHRPPLPALAELELRSGAER